MRTTLFVAGSLVTWSFAGGLLGACGSSLSGPPGGGPGSEGGSSEGGVTVESGLPGPDATAPGSDAGIDSMTSTDSGPRKDSTTVDVVEEPPPCLPESTDDTTGIYVANGGTDNSVCGTRTARCATVSYALGLAATANAETPGTYQYIYVGPGTFTETTQLNLVNGVDVVGGWEISSGEVWTHSCVAPEIDVTEPVLATGLTSSTVLDTLSIVNTTSTAGTTTGVSVYGLLSNDSTLVLNSVSISVPVAGDGTPGAAVSGSGAPGGTGCTTYGTGLAGDTGATGSPTGAGSFSSSGYTPAVALTTVPNVGAVGDSGSNGVMVTPTPVTGTQTTCTDIGCEDAGATYSISGTAGPPGCGGSGGPPGYGGSGGGCSIALYVWGGTITITGGSLTSGNGGAGGAGSAGGKGGMGAMGAAGSPTPIPYCDKTVESKLGIGCGYPGNAAPSTGGTGGNGGNGGQGGGSTGGCSYAYYAGSSATVTTSPTTELHNGAGGTAGAPNGSVGASAQHAP